MKETIADFRVEKDSIGTKDVPEKCLLRSTVFAGKQRIFI